MYGLEASEPHSLPCPEQQAGTAAECVSDDPARVATAHDLMATGRHCIIPRLEGIPTEYRFSEGVELAARLAKRLVSAGLANPARWIQAGRDPFRFIETALKDYVKVHGSPEIEREFFIRLGLSSDLNPYGADGDSAETGDEMFLILEPESAGYVVLGPTLGLLETVHPRLPVTFFDLFTSVLNRWIRVYDYRDAAERVDQLRQWYGADPDNEAVELPAVDAAIPACLRKKWRPLKGQSIEQLAEKTTNRNVRGLIQGVIDLNRTSLKGNRPDLGERAEENFMDWNPPVPALLAVFNKHDAIEGCFDEECQGMLECPPEPNVILPFSAENAESVCEAFRLLSVVCEVLRQAARLITMMMELAN